ncbi:unnamed protein product [marine sediment metagenome]|uniref:Uncharacterized protein n=1 Tax=marine sediment metagenome TaxID=412755 RepID=X1M9C9_9ZZZZ
MAVRLWDRNTSPAKGVQTDARLGGISAKQALSLRKPCLAEQ